MTLIKDPKTIIRDYYNVKKVLFAFNIIDVDSALGVIDASRVKNSSVIIQTSKKLIQYYGAKNIFSSIRGFIEDSPTNIILHLDHCDDLSIIKECADNGWNSLMFDGSHYGLEENIKKSNEFLSFVKPYKVLTECEIGQILGEEDGFKSESTELVSVEDIKYFIDAVQSDITAVGIGNMHGHYKKLKLDISILEAVSEYCNRPLVLHGGTGIPFPIMKESIQYGVVKINISTDIKQSYRDSLQLFNEEGSTDFIKLKMMIREKTKETILKYFSF